MSVVSSDSIIKSSSLATSSLETQCRCRRSQIRLFDSTVFDWTIRYDMNPFSSSFFSKEKRIVGATELMEQTSYTYLLFEPLLEL